MYQTTLLAFSSYEFLGKDIAIWDYKTGGEFVRSSRVLNDVAMMRSGAFTEEHDKLHTTVNNKTYECNAYNNFKKNT